MKKMHCIGLAALTAALCGLWAIAEDAATDKPGKDATADAGQEATLPKKKYYVNVTTLLEMVRKMPKAYRTKDDWLKERRHCIIPEGLYLKQERLFKQVKVDRIAPDGGNGNKGGYIFYGQTREAGTLVQILYCLFPEADNDDGTPPQYAANKIAQLNAGFEKDKPEPMQGGYVVDVYQRGDYMDVVITDIPEVYKHFKELQAQEPFKVYEPPKEEKKKKKRR